MKKLTLLLLLLVSINVFAEWTKVGGPANGGYDNYIDFETIRKKGNKVKMWYMLNFKVPEKDGPYRFLSLVSLDNYDCEEETQQEINTITYSLHMGKGKVVYNTNKESTPLPVPPNSMSESRLLIACGKK